MGAFRSTTTNGTKSYNEQQNPPYTHIKAETYICNSNNHSQLGFKDSMVGLAPYNILWAQENYITILICSDILHIT